MKISFKKNVDNKIVYLCEILTLKVTIILVLKHIILCTKTTEMALLSYAFGMFSIFLGHNFIITTYTMIVTSLIEIDDSWYMTSGAEVNFITYCRQIYQDTHSTQYPIKLYTNLLIYPKNVCYRPPPLNN